MKILQESDKELESFLSLQVNAVNSAEAELEANRSEKANLCKEIEEIERQKKTASSELLQATNELQLQQSRIAKIQTLISSNLDLDKDGLTFAKLNSIFSELQHKAEGFEKELSLLTAKYHQEENELKIKRQRIKDQMHSLTETIKSKKREQSNCHLQKSSILSSLQELSSISREFIEQQEFQYQMENELLAKKKSTCSRFQFEEKLSQLEKEKLQIEGELLENQDLLKELNRASEANTKISIKRTDLRRKEIAYKQAFNSVCSYSSQHLGNSPSESIDDIISYCALSSHELDIKKGVVSSSIEELAKGININKLKLESFQAQLEEANSNLLKNRLKSESFFELVKCSGLLSSNEYFEQQTSFPLVLKKLDALHVELTKRLSSSRELENIYGSFLQASLCTSECSLCCRRFSCELEKERFTLKLTNLIANIPSEVRVYQDQLTKLDAIHVKSREIQTHLDYIQDLEGERIPALIKNIEIHTGQIEALNLSLEKASSELKSLEELAGKYEGLMKLVESATKIQKEIKQIEQEILFIEKSDNIGVNSSHSFDSIQEKTASLLRKSTIIRGESDVISKDYSTKLSDIQMLELQLKDKFSELNVLKSKFEHKLRLENQLAELSKLDSSLQVEIQSSQAYLDTENQTLLSDIQSRSCEIANSYKNDELALREARRSFLAYFNPFSLILSECCEWENRRGIDFVTSEVVSLQDKISRFSIKQDELRETISRLDALFLSYSQKASEIRNIERNVRDNIKSRSMSKAISLKREELTGLLNEYSSGLPYIEYRRQEEELKREHSELLVKVSMAH